MSAQTPTKSLVDDQSVTLGTTIALGDAPAVGFGQAQVVAPTVAAPGPWKIALTTSVLSAVTGWVLEGVSRSVRNGRRRR